MKWSTKSILKNIFAAMLATAVILIPTPQIIFASETEETSVSQPDHTIGSWQEDENGTWFCLTDQSYPQNEWLCLKNIWYHFNQEGYLDTGWQWIDGSWYYLRADGSMITDWLFWKNQWYYLNESGAMKTGWFNPEGETDQNIRNWYYFNSQTGAMQKGWVFSEDSWYYLDGDGHPTIGMFQADGKSYCTNDFGELIFGNFSHGGREYTTDASGAVLSLPYSLES